MKQVRAIFELVLTDVPDLFAYKKGLLKSLGAELKPNDPIFTESVNVRIEDQFGHVTVEAKRVHITVERINSKKAETFILNTFSKVIETLKFGKIARFGYRCMFVQETDHSFEKLVDTYREAFFKEIPLINEAADVGTPLVFERDGYRINFMSGPMKEDQILSMIEYKEGLSFKNSFFVDIDYGKTNVKVDLRTAKELIEKAREVQEEMIAKYEGAIYE